jgi:hypothetical protein
LTVFSERADRSDQSIFAAPVGRWIFTVCELPFDYDEDMPMRIAEGPRGHAAHHQCAVCRRTAGKGSIPAVLCPIAVGYLCHDLVGDPVKYYPELGRNGDHKLVAVSCVSRDRQQLLAGLNNFVRVSHLTFSFRRIPVLPTSIRQAASLTALSEW